MAGQVLFHSRPDSLRLVFDEDDRGRPIYLTFRQGDLRTSEPTEIEFLTHVAEETPTMVWFDDEVGSFVCPECHKAFLTELALLGHSRSHKAAETVEEVTVQVASEALASVLPVEEPVEPKKPKKTRGKAKAKPKKTK